VTGTYQWNATYTSGDGNNNAASDIDATDEQVPVSPASPAIATTPDPTSVTLGTTGVTLKDSAVLSGGYFPTGTITFTLVAPGGATVDTETVTVNGNGTYTTPTGYTLPTTGTVTGTYQWNATYTSGDGNNNAASDINATDEQVPVSPASPAIATTPDPTSVTLGTTTVTLKDSAVLSGGYFPTGTITFTLVAPGGATVDTETVTVNGNGTYTTPTGYTLPTTGTVTGTYQWNATYTSGDGNNNAASDIDATDEQVMVSSASPAIATTPDPTKVTVRPAPTVLNDAATLSGGYHPTGTITFTLTYNGGVVYTDHVTVEGNSTYSTALGDHPGGYTLPTTGTVAGTYQWSATYSGDPNNGTGHDQGGTSEQVKVCPLVVNVQRFGVHHQPTQVVITFDGPLNPAQAQNIANYHIYTLGPDGRFDREVPIKSAVYNAANHTVTLTTAYQFNVHHFAEISVTNPCPGCPNFTGILNRRYSLGDIVWHNGHVWLPPKTDIPGVLNPADLPPVITPANLPIVLKLSRLPKSGAFYVPKVSWATSTNQRQVRATFSSPIAAARKVFGLLSTRLAKLHRHVIPKVR
jgi:hypothetical protein